MNISLMNHSTETIFTFVLLWTIEQNMQQAIMFQGEDYDRVKLLHIDAIEAERLNRKKKKKNPDPGFADYEQATAR